MLVYPERMLRNLESTRGLVFSGQLLLDLVEPASRARMLTAWCSRTPCTPGRRRLDFHQLVLADKEITSRVPRQQVEYAFDLKRQLNNVDKIFARVFGPKKQKPPKAAGKVSRSDDRTGWN